ncbi:MAG: hemolysin family protein [Cyanobacteria bacterium REEB65]|nr:hemolysin family protein [Cyanobacteria bacterium REEB65]
MGTLSEAIEFSILILALAASAFFAGAEAAFTGLDRVRLRQRLDEGSQAAKRVAGLNSQPQRLVATLLLLHTTAMVVVAVLGSRLAAQLWSGQGLLAALAVLILALVLLGEMLPRSLAAAKPEVSAEQVAVPVSWLVWLLRPLVSGVLLLAVPLIRMFGGKGFAAATRYTEDELRTLVEIGEEQGALEDSEATLVTSALAFDDTLVSAVLTPRVDIVAIPDDAPVEAVLKLIAEQGYSRLPVYRETIDEIVGILHVKDLLIALSRRGPIDLAQWIRPVHAVPINKKLHELLREMQEQGIEMAIVNDEYGGTMGLVTQEDILEQIVGELRDEYDEKGEAIRHLCEGMAQVDGMAPIMEINEALGLELPLNGYQTIGGLVINSLGRVAKVGDVVEAGAGVRVTVKSLKGIRVQLVLIEYPEGIEPSA